MSNAKPNSSLSTVANVGFHQVQPNLPEKICQSMMAVISKTQLAYRPPQLLFFAG
ncbi:hypothetical protein ACKFKF_28810 [Phormidesmis sp. 146-12]